MREKQDWWSGRGGRGDFVTRECDLPGRNRPEKGRRGKDTDGKRNKGKKGTRGHGDMGNKGTRVEEKNGRKEKKEEQKK